MTNKIIIYAILAVLCPCLTLAKDVKFIGAGKENGAKPAIVAKDAINAKNVVHAEWRVTGLGVFTVAVNGHMSGISALMPGFTTPQKRRMEYSLDVTRLWNGLQGATNTLSATVTSGWWCDGIMGKSGGTWPAFRGILVLTYEDGSKEEIVTDETWRVSSETPVVSAGIWEGEVFDARIKPANWKMAAVSDEFHGEVSPWIGPDIVYREDLAMGLGSAGEFSLKAGEKKIVDFGQNCAAIPSLKVMAEEGTKVTIRFGEMLNDGIKGHHGDGPEGSLYTANMRGAKSAVDYVCRGGGEIFWPWHTFYGYRYAEISADGDIEGSLRSLPVTSISKEMEHGKVVTGDKAVNRLVQNAYWGMLSNYLSVPTDCPQRTERLGWTGDTQVFVKTAAYFADVRGFFEKWMQDIRDSQHTDGVVPHVVPKAAFGDNGPIAGWSDAAIIVPWTMWKYLGDEETVRKNWDVMCKYIDCVAKNDYTVGRTWLLCDWLSFERLSVDQSKRWSNGSYTADHLSYQNFLNACYLLWDAILMQELQEKIPALARREDFAAIEKRIREKILSTWFTREGALCALFDNMQTPRIYALKLGLGERKLLAKELADIVRANGNRLSTGFLGTPFLLEELGNIGEAQLAYDVLLNHSFPGWLYSVDQGATTCWERWDSYTKERGFGDVRMNSFNHYAYGAVVSWLFETAGGLKPGEDGGWKSFTIAPKPDKRLGSCRVEFDGGYGKIVSEWHYEGDELKFSCKIPEGCTATVVDPTK